MVGGRVVEGQIAGLLGASHVGEHRRLGSGAGEGGEELGVLEVQPVFEAQRAADVGAALDRRDGELQALGEMVAEREGAVDQLVRRHDLVDVADLRGGLGVEAAAVEHPLEALVGPDEPHQALGSAAAGREAEQDLGLADDVVACGHEAEVAGESEL